MSDGMLAENGPVFIVGMNGSGTTMLLDHLDSHPELYGFPVETRILPWYLDNAAQFGDLRSDENFRNLWDRMRRLSPVCEANLHHPLPLPEDWTRAPRSVAGIFDRLMMQFACVAGKHRWCEKTPMHVVHMSKLATAFPNAKFIHLIRDGRDCAASFHRRWRYHPRRTLLRWKRIVAEGRRQGAELGTKYLEVSYEAITGDPEAELDRICDFLGVPFHPAIRQSSRQRARMKGNAAPNIARNPRNHLTYFKPRELERLNCIAGKTLAHLGYSTSHPEGDNDPPPWQLRLWTFRDRVWYVFFTIRSKVQYGKRVPWRSIFGRVGSAWKQRTTNRF